MTYTMPTDIIFGGGSLARLPRLLKGYNSIALFHGQASFAICKDQVFSHLEGWDLMEIPGVSPEPQVQDLVDAKRANPGQDLISALIEAEEDGDKLDIEELLSLCSILLVAGHETTSRLISSCLLLLLQHPDQLAEVRSDRSLLKNAIEEALRLEPPVLGISRLVPETFEYKGCVFKKGQLIQLSIAGANRDPKVTPSPEVFNIHREAFEHLSFGHGIHLCLGMPLA